MRLITPLSQNGLVSQFSAKQKLAGYQSQIVLVNVSDMVAGSLYLVSVIASEILFVLKGSGHYW